MRKDYLENLAKVANMISFDPASGIMKIRFTKISQITGEGMNDERD